MIKKKRYMRDPKWKTKEWRFTELDKQILLQLSRYRYLRGGYIARLVGRPRKTVNHALNKLHGVELVDKPRKQFLGWNSLNDSDIYELTPAGQKRITIEHPPVTNILRMYSYAQPKQFSHAMMICDTLSSIEIGVRDADGYTFIPEGEIVEHSSVTDPLKIPCTLNHTFRNGHHERITTYARPDGVFGIKYPDGRTRLFVLEAEHYSAPYRNTFENTSTLKKLLSYADIWASDAMFRNLGKKRFTVLIVSPHQPEVLANEHRTGKPLTAATKIQNLIVDLFGSSEMFLIKTVPVQEELLSAPSPFPELMFSGEWKRGGLPPVTFADLQTKKPPTD
jgi:hypothetical protein